MSRRRAASTLAVTAAAVVCVAVPGSVANAHTHSFRPSAPSRFRAVSSPAKTFLTWNAGAATTSYQVEQSTDPSMRTNTETFTVHGPLTQYTPYDLQPGRTYYFRVRALNGSTPSAYSATTSTQTHAATTGVTVMTYNIKEARYDGTMEGGNVVAPWSTARKPAAVRLIERASPDVIGVQEGADLIGHVRQVDTLRAALGGAYGLARTEIPPSQPGTRRTGVYILYKKATFRAVGKGGHWSLGGKRSAAHQVLRSRATGAEFIFVSTHLWHAGGGAGDMQRKAETKRLVKLGSAAAKRRGIPIVYAGDFNSDPFKKHAFNAPAEVMSQHDIADSYNVAQARDNASYNTANGYQTRPPRDGARIDYVYAPQGVGVGSWKMIMRLRHGRFVGTIPSDHNPVVVSLSVPD
jgi:endonuclease/exonuclease/phosphatase family metal-dependent hydrolase